MSVSSLPDIKSSMFLTSKYTEVHMPMAFFVMFEILFNDGSARASYITNSWLETQQVMEVILYNGELIIHYTYELEETVKSLCFPLNIKLKKISRTYLVLHWKLVIGPVLKIKSSFRRFETEQNLGFCMLATDIVKINRECT